MKINFLDTLVLLIEIILMFGLIFTVFTAAGFTWPYYVITFAGLLIIVFRLTEFRTK